MSNPVIGSENSLKKKKEEENHSSVLKKLMAWSVKGLESKPNDFNPGQ